ncbi:uncharacterized protein TrAFT101_010037 [Trichoderma asperellum]|uniref:DUF7582 domain-containing protein n=1 Tax=Trichoderma asperellum (strain ATCC 204424 / CBS 433.97 / NBRC 101777) TaxID=1042311 RepID=A0A2T3Z961_TRIA4|nr:hypothetical protein M441DRAFT_138671 [Trichoderma asperellum CBS 433.97]PTB41348.1 hypothetical protein M441DRAFT_138671 [Trichoderma asperellum CBS 433.97]UKZ95186.1 hypothetical protein TrAFT101_010037 [Trichoderma asperellum]
MALKDKISSPLEAGPSVLDAQHVPPHLAPVLEYTSSRLAKKAVHLTLIIVRRDYQLLNTNTVASSTPRTPGTPRTPLSPPLTGGSTSSSRLGLSSPVVALKHFMRSASQHVVGSGRSAQSPRSAVPPISRPFTTTELPSPRFRWPLSPTTPLSPPPMTPSTASSLTTIDSNGPPTPTCTGLRCFYSGDLSPRTEKILKSTLIKAGNKFGVGSGWLVPFTSPSTRELATQLFHSSVVQNEILFSSDGLTLLTLDRLYSIKSALSSYSKTGSALMLEDAVDELRRFVLAHNGRRVTRSDLLRSFDWLSVSNSAIMDLDRMYQRAYGGYDQIGGITGMAPEVVTQPFVLDLPPKSKFEDWEDGSLSPSSTILDEDIIGVAVTAVSFVRPPTPRRIGPALKLQTDFSAKSKYLDLGDEVPREDEDSEDEAHTARPVDQTAAAMWNSRLTIDQMLSPNQDLHSPAIGPMTPHGYDDISPVTRGEWGFLMGGNGLQIGKTAAVETF